MSTPIGQRKVRAKKVTGKKVVEIKPPKSLKFREGKDEPPDESPLRLVSLRAQNAGVIQAAFIKPDGSLVVLKGKNGAGKTTCLDLIGWVLCGTRAIPSEPLRRGAETGFVEVELGPIGTTDVTITAKRLINEAGTSLVVKDGKGQPIKNSTTFLKTLYTDLALDPVAWLNLNDREQAESLMAAGGLDFKALNEDHQRIYDKRTVIGRDRDHAKENMRDAQPEDGTDSFDVPAVVDVEPLEGAVFAARENLSKAERAGDAVEHAKELHSSATRAVTEGVEQLADLQEQLLELQENIETLEGRNETRRGIETKSEEGVRIAVALASSVDIEASQHAYSDAQLGLQTAIEDNAARSAIAAQQDRLETTTQTYEEKREEWDAHTTRIEAIDADKIAQLAAAEFPVEGLEVSEEGVQFNGFPFGRASEAERLTVAVHVAMATPGRLRLVTIRSASGLGPELLTVIEQAVAEGDGLAIVEMRYTEPDQKGVVIVEDGWAGIEPGEAS